MIWTHSHVAHKLTKQLVTLEKQLLTSNCVYKYWCTLYQLQLLHCI